MKTYLSTYFVKHGDRIEEGAFVGAIDWHQHDGILYFTFKDESILVIPIANIVGEFVIEVDNQPE